MGIWVSFIPSLEILYGQTHVFRVMNSWKRLSLSMTSGARMQMISAPNIDRLDFLPLPNRGAVSEEGYVKDAVINGTSKVVETSQDRRFVVWECGGSPAWPR